MSDITVRWYVGKGEPITTTVDASDLKAMQKMVAGYIEQFPLRIPRVVLICNEEGCIRGLPIHWVVLGTHSGEPEFIHGDFFVCRVSGDDMASLNEEDIANLDYLIYPCTDPLHRVKTQD